MLDDRQLRMLLETQRRIQESVKYLASPSLSATLQRVQQQAKVSQQHQAARLAERISAANSRLAETVSAANSRLEETVRRMALPNPQILEIRRQIEKYQRAESAMRESLPLLSPGLETPRNSALKPPQEHPQEVGFDFCDKVEKARLIGLFQLRMFLLTLLESTEKWPPEDWTDFEDFDLFGRN